MRLPRIVIHRLRSVFQLSRSEAHLEREIDLHLEQLTREYESFGMDRKEARLHALREFGPVEVTKEYCRDQRRVHIFQDLLRDAAHSVRLVRKNPVFAASAVLILGLSIGANAAIFSVVNAVLLRKLPVQGPDELVEIVRIARGQERARSSFPWYEVLSHQSHSFEGVIAQFEPGKQTIYISGQPDLVETQMVSRSYFEVLGVHLALGSSFTSQSESKTGAAPLAVISYEYWQRRFARSPHVVGKTFRLNQTLFTIIGVSPEGFSGTAPGYNPDVTFPLSMCAEVRNVQGWLSSADVNWLDVMGRLNRGVNREQAQSEARTLFDRWNREHATESETRSDKQLRLRETVLVEPAGSGLNALAVRFAHPLLLAMCMVGLLLTLACVNLSSVLLGKALARTREVSVRIALGASPEARSGSGFLVCSVCLCSAFWTVAALCSCPFR